MKRVGIWLAAACFLAVILGGFLVWRAQPRDLAMTRARIGPAVEIVYATGFVEADQPVSVAARLTAPVAKVLVDEGDRVRRGQPLLVLDDEDQRA
jgi:multidrug efflux pump subunit AcrA (membrane-fusion protein)